MMSRWVGAVVLVAFGLALLSMGMWLLREEEKPVPGLGSMRYPRSRAVADALLSKYVGDRVCGSCHRVQAEQHSQSHHAHTLHRMQRGGPPFSLPTRSWFTESETAAKYAIEEGANGRCDFVVRRPDGKMERRLIEYIFGSGVGGVTFVGQTDGDHAMEFRMSYFPARRKWEVTPGQKENPGDWLGKVRNRPDIQRCFGCHSSAIGESQLVSSYRFFGVGCESCHGPGQDHVTARTRGLADLRLERPRHWTAEKLNDVCAQCHRAERDIDPISTSELQMTQRFQPYGLMKSACYQKSPKGISCVACHDPHQNAVRKPGHYVQVCKSCHAQDSKTPVKLCPINPADACIGCHMPKREVFGGIKMADHWIRVFQNKNKTTDR